MFCFVFACLVVCSVFFFFFKQKTAYDMRISDWSSDVCSSDLYRCVPTLTAEQMPDFIDCYRVRFLSRDPGIKLFDGITDLFATLRSRQIALGVATGKSRVGLDRVLTAQNLHEHFHVTRCADETQSKTHPAMLLEIM